MSGSPQGAADPKRAVEGATRHLPCRGRALGRSDAHLLRNVGRAKQNGREKNFVASPSLRPHRGQPRRPPSAVGMRREVLHRVCGDPPTRALLRERHPVYRAAAATRRAQEQPIPSCAAGWPRSLHRRDGVTTFALQHSHLDGARSKQAGLWQGPPQGVRKGDLRSGAPFCAIEIWPDFLPEAQEGREADQDRKGSRLVRSCTSE